MSAPAIFGFHTTAISDLKTTKCWLSLQIWQMVGRYKDIFCRWGWTYESKTTQVVIYADLVATYHVYSVQNLGVLNSLLYKYIPRTTIVYWSYIKITAFDSSIPYLAIVVKFVSKYLQLNPWSWEPIVYRSHPLQYKCFLLLVVAIWGCLCTWLLNANLKSSK